MPLRLLAAGDICPGDHYFTLGHGTGSRLATGDNPFASIESLLQAADICIANLEGPLSDRSDNRPGPESTVFRGPPSSAALLRRTNFQFLHIANNHILQHGADAFRETISHLEAQRISIVGRLEAGHAVPVRTTIESLTLGFLGYSFVPDRYLPNHSLYATGQLPLVLEEIRSLKNEVDLVVVSVHWGEEAMPAPGQDTVDAAHAMVASGATLVLGHHPHWFQPVEQIGRALVAYSLGDFVFDLFWDRRLVESAILSVDLDKDGVVDHRLIPVRFGRDYQVRPLTGRQADRFVAEIEEQAKSLSTGGEPPAPLSAREESLRKMGFFLSSLHKGNTSQKLRFLFEKIRKPADTPTKSRAQ